MISTDTRRTPTAPPADERQLGLAVRTELRMNAGRVATTLIACAAALLWAAIASDQYAGLLTLWAALAWYRYGRADTIEREELRASLGLSRADRVRGRVLLIGMEQAAVVLTVAAGAVLSVLLGRESIGGAAPFTFGGSPSGPQIWIVLAGALFSAAALLITGMVVGGECTVGRPGRGMAVTSVLTYFISGVLLAIPLMLTELALSVDPWSGRLGTLVTVALFCAVVLLLVLRLRAAARRWIRELDSGVVAR